ncbi:MAG TPA: sulfotransferase [Rhizomicrobium sp.]|nr:sulfotransferase [Rhizomicrobium sp.]
MPFSPIFIVGVPRSGTTLLRVLLDSHSQILGLPETPWVCGAYGGSLSLRQLLVDLMDGPYGIVRNIAGIERADVLSAGAGFLEALFAPALRARGKKEIAFKTPSDIPHLEFLTALLPQARYIHITRDGRDVALSQLSKKGSFFLELRGYRRFSYANVLQRWVDWEQKAHAVLSRQGLRVFHLRYEDLIADPEGQMRRVLAFLNLPFEPAMLDYAAQSHDYPKWEAGSTDVAQRGNVSDRSVGKWRTGKKSVEMLHALMRHDQALVRLGYPPSELNCGLGQRLLIAAYGFIQPGQEILSLVALRARPVFRGPIRFFACLCLFLLALVLLVPFGILDSGMGALLGPALSFGAVFSFVAGFLPALQRAAGCGPSAALFRAGSLMLGYLVLLQAGQLLIAGRPPEWNRFLLEVIAVFAALLAAIPWVLKMQQPARIA